MCATCVGIYHPQILSPKVTLVTFLEDRWSGTCEDTRPKANCKFLPSFTNKEPQCLRSSLDFGGNIYLIWVCCLNPLYIECKRLLVLNGAQNRSRICDRPAAVEAVLSFGLYTQLIQCCLKYLRQIEILHGTFGHPL